jgi:hypothetical protein
LPSTSGPPFATTPHTIDALVPSRIYIFVSPRERTTLPSSLLFFLSSYFFFFLFISRCSLHPQQRPFDGPLHNCHIPPHLHIPISSPCLRSSHGHLPHVAEAPAEVAEGVSPAEAVADPTARTSRLLTTTTWARLRMRASLPSFESNMATRLR